MAVKIDRRLVGMARILAGRENIPMAELLSDILRGQLERANGKEMQDLNSETDEKKRREVTPMTEGDIPDLGIDTSPPPSRPRRKPRPSTMLLLLRAVVRLIGVVARGTAMLILVLAVLLWCPPGRFFRPAGAAGRLHPRPLRLLCGLT